MSKHSKLHLAHLHRPPTLLEVLQPSFYQANPKRSEVTTTVIQPDIDKYGHLDADDFPAHAGSEDDEHLACSGRRTGHKRPTARAAATACGERP